MATSRAKGSGGQLQPGNIDLGKRPVVKNKDGTYSTVRSITIGVGGKQILIPTVVGNKVVSNAAAIAHWRKTGENLGTFADNASAERAAQRIHVQQAKQYPDPIDRFHDDARRQFADPAHQQTYVQTREQLLHDEIVKAAKVAARNTQRAAPAPSMEQKGRQVLAQYSGGKNSSLHFGNLTKGWAGVGKDLVQPFVEAVKHPSVQTGIGAAAAFPWGTRMRAPRSWDLAAGGRVERIGAEKGYGKGSLESTYEARDPSGKPIGVSKLSMYPDVSNVDWINTLEPKAPPPLSTFTDLLAPAINRHRVHGVPIDAQVVNPKLAALLLKMSKRNPGMFHPEALKAAQETLSYKGQ